MSDYYRSSSGSSGNQNGQQLMLQRLHANSHQTTFIGAWLLAGFAILTIIASLFIMIGVWNANANRTEDFKNYCYAVWGVLAAGLVLVIGFLMYFHWNMNNLWNKGRANIDLAFSSNPYSLVDKKEDPYTKRIKEAQTKIKLEQLRAQEAGLKKASKEVSRQQDNRQQDNRQQDNRQQYNRQQDNR